jgi:exodeoxyribonuclease V alpha subunit
MTVHSRRWLPAVGEALTDTLLQGMPEPDADTAALLRELGTALLRALADGCLEIDLGGPAPAEVDGARWPQAHRRALERSGWLAEGGPVVLVGQRLLWRRWHERMGGLRQALLDRCRTVGPAASRGGAALPPELFSNGLDADQRRAVAMAPRTPLLLLSGGPGTGKTSTVARMLLAVMAVRPGLRIQLAAPTGKAAGRLRQAVGAAWPEEHAERRPPATTVHRLLARRRSRVGSGPPEPLPIDLLVVDEMSMVDLALMEGLLAALPPEASLILVGDPDQLPPIGPGAVWHELQDPAWRRQLGDAAIRLGRVYRNNGAIAAVADRVRRGDPGALAASLQSLPEDANLRWLSHAGDRLPPECLQRLRAHARRLARLAEAVDGGGPAAAAALLEAVETFTVLSPRRSGAWGVNALHRALLGRDLAAPPVRWPVGTPVLCGRNLADLGLANGDVGVLARRDGRPWLLFRSAGEMLWLHPARVPDLEPALAMTVHKAQGSQYDALILLAPAGAEADRRLLYTGLTRARRELTLVTPPAM